MGVMYSTDNAASDSAAVPSVEGASDDSQLQAALLRNVSLPAAVAFMVFVLLYFPCIATFIAVKSETGGWKWAILLAIYTMLVAWIMAFAAFHIAALLL